MSISKKEVEKVVTLTLNLSNIDLDIPEKQLNEFLEIVKEFEEKDENTPLRELAKLANLDLKKDFAGADLSDYVMNGYDLIQANLYRTILSKADLGEADLSEANLRGADLTGANLRGANLREANFTDADLTSANLREANLRDAILLRVDVSGADLSGADLRGANLRDTNFTNSNLSDADLRGANFLRADFTGADLTGADLTGASIDQMETEQGSTKISTVNLRSLIQPKSSVKFSTTLEQLEIMAQERFLLELTFNSILRKKNILIPQSRNPYYRLNLSFFESSLAHEEVQERDF
jgi:uncharacterized protein YjbI with pentapeptide repeats